MKPGGLLVYSTCTFAPDEDEIQIADFLSENGDYEILEVPLFGYFDKGHKEWLKKDYPSDITDSIEKCARLWPHKIDGEGHFVCILKKAGQIEENDVNESLTEFSKSKKKDKNLKKQNSNGNGIDRKSEEVIRDFLDRNLKDFSYSKEDLISVSDYVYLQPKGFDVNCDKLRVVRNGLQLGIIKKDRFEPSHSLAMALTKEKVKRFVELDDDEALKYRHGEEIRKECENGWALITVQGVSLGWGKAVNGVIKNHYPKGLRIKF